MARTSELPEALANMGQQNGCRCAATQRVADRAGLDSRAETNRGSSVPAGGERFPRDPRRCGLRRSQIPNPEPVTEAEALRNRVVGEIRMLHPWYDEGRKARGRMAFGVAGKGVEAVEEMASTLAESITGSEVEPEGFKQPMPVLLKYLADDIKTFSTRRRRRAPAWCPHRGNSTTGSSARRSSAVRRSIS